MKQESWLTVAGLVGIAAIIVGGVAVELAGYPARDASLSDYASSYADSSRRIVVGINWLLTTVGGVLLLCMIPALRASIAPSNARLSTASVAAAAFATVSVAFVLLLIASTAAHDAYSGADYFGAFTFDVESARIALIFDILGHRLVASSVACGAAALAIGAQLGRRNATLPGWLSSTGYVLAVVALAFAIPLESLGVLLVLLWLAGASLWLLRAESIG